MGYQALLFCPDEKLARIVAQVFSDLEFNVEPVQEPFSAVKKLMSQRYDALVVDCENESNASLLFKSARNSSSNQGTLAIAVVEGQAGVAKAYRIGANLVLTKPINVEQAKGTLRVARGLLRKNAEVTASPTNPVSHAAPSVPQASAAAAATVAPDSIAAAPVKPAGAPSMPPRVARELPEFEPPTPAIAAQAAETPVAATPAPEPPVKNAAPAQIPAPVASPAPMEPAKPAVIVASATGSVAVAQGAAVAPAKVKEVTPAARQAVELQPDPVLEAADTEPVGSTPSFSALDLDNSGTAGGSKKILIAAGVVIAVAALGYIGVSKMGSHKSGSATVQSVSTPPQPSSPAPAPTPTPAASTAAPGPVGEHSSLTSEPASSKIAPSAEPQKSASQATIRPQTDSEPEVKTTNFIAPLKVKSGTVDHTKRSSDDANAPVPNPLAVADANSGALSSLVTSPAATAHPTLATLKISQGVSQGLLIKRVDPKYPPSALSMHVQGAVVLDATINREGNITNLSVVKGDKILAHAATDAVKQWRYKPYYLDGAPVEIQTQIVINFKLPN